MSFFCVCLSFKKSYDFEFYCHNHDYYKWLLNKSCISNNILNLLLGSLTGFNSSFIRIQQYMKKQRLFVQMEHVACRYIWKILYIVNVCLNVENELIDLVTEDGAIFEFDIWIFQMNELI